MKRAIEVKSAPAPGFSTGNDSVCGKKALGFFGSKESVSFSIVFAILNLHVQHLQRDAVKALYGESPLPEGNISRNENPSSSKFLDFR